MWSLIARANEVMLEAQRLRREGHVLRREAAIRASELGKTIVRAATAAESRDHASGPTVSAEDVS